MFALGFETTHKKTPCKTRGYAEKYGASDEIRTHDIHLGKVMLYQLSYARVCDVNDHSDISLFGNPKFQIFLSEPTRISSAFPRMYANQRDAYREGTTDSHGFARIFWG